MDKFWAIVLVMTEYSTEQISPLICLLSIINRWSERCWSWGEKKREHCGKGLWHSNSVVTFLLSIFTVPVWEECYSPWSLFCWPCASSVSFYKMKLLSPYIWLHNFVFLINLGLCFYRQKLANVNCPVSFWSTFFQQCFGEVRPLKFFSVGQVKGHSIGQPHLVTLSLASRLWELVLLVLGSESHPECNKACLHINAQHT